MLFYLKVLRNAIVNNNIENNNTENIVPHQMPKWISGTSDGPLTSDRPLTVSLSPYPGGRAVPQDQSPTSTCPPGPPGPLEATAGGGDISVNFDPDPADLALSSVPGQEAFDPRRHRFSDEELKPQPMIKKARKMLVPNEQKVLHLPQSIAAPLHVVMIRMCRI